MSKPRIVVTMGDPAGIGPEIVIKALSVWDPSVAEIAVVGSHSCLADTAATLGVELPLHPATIPGPWPLLSVFDIGKPRQGIEFGKTCAEAGRLAYRAIARAVELALAGHVDAIVTAPISKEALHRAGHHFAGHTEILTELTGSKDSCMFLVHDRLRVAHVSTHVALKDAAARLTPDRLNRVIALTRDALARLGLPDPRIAVAALNPHAGEEGAFGDEDRTIIRPVVRRLQESGCNIEGPISGDIVFVKASAGQYDAVIAMYHDQGHIPVKLLGFAIDSKTGHWNSVSGVNVTLGLPIVRTSVDHGTAFDIAGKGVANEQSLLEAIDLAMRFAADVPVGRGT